MAAIFELTLALTSGCVTCVCTSTIVLLEVENVRVAVGIFLLSCIQAELYAFSFVLPVNGGHFRILTNPEVGQFPN